MIAHYIVHCNYMYILKVMTQMKTFYLNGISLGHSELDLFPFYVSCVVKMIRHILMSYFLSSTKYYCTFVYSCSLVLMLINFLARN